MPCAVELILREPLPFIVMSPLEKITPSTLLSSVATKVPEVVSVLVVPSLSVIKTLSASFTYMAALLSLVIVTPSSTSCTFAVSATFTTICPEYVPESI